MTKEVRFFKGTSAMAAASIFRLAIQLCVLPLIGRLLGPTAYGEIALVSPFVFFAMMLAESGLGTCIVQAETVTNELVGTIFLFSMGLSIAIIGLFALLAFPIGNMLHAPTFPPLLMAMSSILLMAAIAIVPTAMLLRSRLYNTLAMSDVASSLGGLIGVSLGIFLGLGVWSLVLQQVCLWVAKLMILVTAAKWRPIFVFDKRVLAKYLSFSSHLTGSNTLSFVSKNIDNLLIGAIMGAQTLGYYAFAFQIVGMPAMVLSASLYFNMLFITTEQKRAGQFPSELFLKMLHAVMVVASPLVIGAAITAPLSIPLILGDKWEPAIKIFILLTPLGLQQIITCMSNGIIIGLERPDIILRLNLINSIMLVTAIIAGLCLSSAAVAAGVSLASIFNAFLHLRFIAKRGNIPIRSLTKAIFVPLGTALMMAMLVYVEYLCFPAVMPKIVQLCLMVALGALTYGATIIFLLHEDLAEDLRVLRRLLTKRGTV